MSRTAAPRKLSTVAEKSTARELPQVFFRLLMSHRAWVKSTVMGFGLSAFQAMPLVLMDPSRPATMSEVAAIVGCGPSNLTGIVDKLEARGLVKRRPGQGDRRVKEVSLTRAGVAFRKRILARIREPAPWMLALSPADQRQLIEILRKALASAPAPEGAPAAARELLEAGS
jgi:MarR family transcriptional regulator, organic hydroperoxide resistance regulator